MDKLLKIFQLAVSFFLILLILLQGRGVGLSSPFGGGGETFRTRRGFEKILFYLTILGAVLFSGTLLVAAIQ